MTIYREYIPGDRLVDCDVCGFTRRRSEMLRGIFARQKGLIVCADTCFDDVHPNEARVKHKSEGKLEEIR